MSTTTAKKTQAAKPAARPTKPAPPTAQPVSAKKPTAQPAPKEEPKAVVPEPKTLVEALTTGQSVLVKIRANKTVRSLPYLPTGSEERKSAEDVAARRGKGETVEAIAKDLNVSVATVRRFVSNLALAQEVESGQHDKAWTKGEKQVVVHTVVAKAKA